MDCRLHCGEDPHEILTVRLTPAQRPAIVEETTRDFGPGTAMRLFGSRVDDTQRGGDIDLLIEAGGTPAELLDRELALRAQLMHRQGERRIDIVLYDPQRLLRAIDRHALQMGIRL